MANFNIRLVQQVTEQGFADFSIEATTPDAAAELVRKAYKIARAEGSSVVRLNDGQIQVLERVEVLDRSVSFILLDQDGEEIGPIGPLPIRLT